MDAAFYFDLASPLAYLAAERILHELPGPIEWQPVLACELESTTPDEPEPATPRRPKPGEPEPEPTMPRQPPTPRQPATSRVEIERRAAELGLQPLRWPQDFPFDSEPAMLAATYAKSIGRVVPFAQAAFRQAFAGGRDLSQLDSVLIAAAACEMHPQAVLRAVELRSVRAQLAACTRVAAAAGVRVVPTVRLGERLFCGPRALADARRSRGAAAEIGESKKAKTDRRDRADQKNEISNRQISDRPYPRAAGDARR